MERLTLRRANAEDRDFAFRVRKIAFRPYVEKEDGWDEREQQQVHERRFMEQDFRVISFAGEDIGVMAVAAGPDCLSVNQLLLLPKHQGKGVGQMCMCLIMEEAVTLGLPVRLRTMKVNPRARAFFQKLGFVRTGETDTHVHMEWAP